MPGRIVDDPAAQHKLEDVEQTVSTLLASHQMPLPATFSFDFLGAPFDVGVRRCSEGGAQMVVRGRLGNLPYSAVSVIARDLLSSVVDAGRSLPLAEISVDGKQSIVVRGEMNFSTVPSPANISAGAAAITVAVKPVCELLAKCRGMSDYKPAWSQST